MFKSDKKKHVIIRTIAFVLVFIGLFLYIETISNDDYYTYEGWGYVYEDDIDVLIMGSSQAHCSFDAKKITDETGKSTVVLSSGAQNIKQTYFNLLEVVKYQNPDLIVIESFSIIEDTLTWMEETGSNGLALQNLDGMKMSPLKVWSAFSTLGFDGYGVFQIMRESGKTERLIAAIKNIIPNTKNIFKDKHKELKPKRGYEPVDPTMHITEEQYQRQYKYTIDDDYELPRQNIKYLDKVIRICHKNNIDIEFIKTPMLKRESSMNGHLALERYLNKKGYDIKAYNLMEKEYNLELLQEDYADINHISESGVEKISDWFIGHINEYYKVKN